LSFFSPENSETKYASKRQRGYQLLWVLALLMSATLVNYLFDGDRLLAEKIYGSDHLWPGIGKFPWNIIYNWAPLPGLTLAGLALLTGIGSFFTLRLKNRRREAVFILLLLALGPGLIVNVLLKDQLGRARPREIVECGGTHQYTEIWEKGTTGANSSFPSGHASIAFFTLAPWFILRDKQEKHQKNKGLANSFLVFGIVFGAVVGFARILQGGHFLNDVIWAGGIVYLVGGLLALILLPGGERSNP
jgi:membrane-associated PAP2 superfamily phosphatase